MTTVKVGQVWASTHHHDVQDGLRQRRRVVEASACFAWLQTLDSAASIGSSRATRVRLRVTRSGETIPGHRLVEDVAG